MKILLSLCLLLFCQLSWAAEQNYQFDNQMQRELFLELTKELRCPMCQNQNIADSDAMVAQDLRRKVYELIREGNDRQQVIDFMKQRYGDFVHYQPPVTPITLWLWLLPVLFVLAAGIYIVSKKRVVETSDEQAKLAEAEKMLERDQ